MAILKCVCYHKAQDKLHGKQMRVFNLTKKGGENTYRCTVCLRERTGLKLDDMNAKQLGDN